MSIPAYDLYKDSDVDWLGNVPTHWQVLPLHRVIRDKRRITYGIVQPGKADENGRYMVRGQDYSTGWARPETLFRVSDEIETPYKRSRLLPGDIVMTIVGAGVGNVATIPEWLDGANITQTTARLSVDPEKADPNFVSFVLQSSVGRRCVELYSKGAAQPGLNLEHVRTFPVTVPPLDEQKAISSFLDVETSKIDALVSEQRRLIELLKEKRQAVISHTVTKGRDPKVPMKDSGIQWLGDVPAHWTLHHLRRLVTKFVDYRGRTPTKTDSGVPLITARAIRDGVIDHSRCPEYIAESDYDELMSRGLPEVGDVVITTEAPLGEVAQVDDPNVAFAQRVILFKGNKERMLPDFMRYWYLAINGRDELYSRASGSTASGIRADRLKRSVVPTPPIHEQQQIVNYLRPVLERLLAPIADAERAIELLQERRTALISAAVTGKIDVRGFACKETA